MTLQDYSGKRFLARLKKEYQEEEEKEKEEEEENMTGSPRPWRREGGGPMSRFCSVPAPAESQAAGGPFQSCFSHPHVRVDAPRRRRSPQLVYILFVSSSRNPRRATLTIALVTSAHAVIYTYIYGQYIYIRTQVKQEIDSTEEAAWPAKRK